MFCAVDIIVDNYYLLWSSASNLTQKFSQDLIVAGM